MQSLHGLDGATQCLLYCQCPGEMSERLKVPVLKTGVAKATVGSNPTLSAIKKRYIQGVCLFFVTEMSWDSKRPST